MNLGQIIISNYFSDLGDGVVDLVLYIINIFRE